MIKAVSIGVLLVAILPSAVIAMVIKDGEGIFFTKDEVELLTTRVKDQDNAVKDLTMEVERLKEQVKRVTDKSCI